MCGLLVILIFTILCYILDAVCFENTCKNFFLIFYPRSRGHAVRLEPRLTLYALFVITSPLEDFSSVILQLVSTQISAKIEDLFQAFYLAA